MNTLRRLAVIGATGQLGRDLVDTARRRALTVEPLGHDAIEIADPQSVARALDRIDPSVVINTAACQGGTAYGADDQAAFFRGNALGPWNLARWCARRDVPIVHYSTDYVFGGGRPDRPLTERDMPAPLNVYGASKLAGEHLVRATAPRHFVLRVATLYGRGGCRAKGHSSFVSMVLRRAAAGEPLQIVDDQAMSPTSTADLARLTLDLLDADPDPGLYHAAGRGGCSWFELACEVVRLAGLDTLVEPACSQNAEPGSGFIRPRYTVLDNTSLREAGLPDLPPWRDSLAAHVAAEPDYQPVETLR